MARFPVNPVTGLYSFIPWDWEILETFFLNNDIVPVWINCHFTWGWYDEEAGKWTGAVGKVSRSSMLIQRTDDDIFVHRLKLTRLTWLYSICPVLMLVLQWPCVCQV